MNKLFTPNGWQDYIYWQTEDKKTLKNANLVVEDTTYLEFDTLMDIFNK